MPPDTPSPAAEPPWRTALAGPPVHAPPRVLVAEDDMEMRRLLCDTLRQDGCEVIAVPDGGRLLVALAHAIADPGGQAAVDLILSDVRMPICSGMQILEQLRAAHRRKPFILMTAFGDAGTRARARSLGALLFDKPFDLDDVRTAVASLLRRTAQPDDASSRGTATAHGKSTR